MVTAPSTCESRPRIDDRLGVLGQRLQRRVIDGGAHLRGKARIAGPQLAFSVVTDNAGARPGDHVPHLGGCDAAARGLLPDGRGAVMFGLCFDPRQKRQEARSSPSSATTRVTAALPVVRVPVLSKAKVSTAASVSSAAPPLNSTPPRAAADSAERIAAGTEMTMAQGLAATSRVADR